MDNQVVKFYCNGFIVKRMDSQWAKNYINGKHGFCYLGIEGDNWPINTDSENVDEQEIEYLNQYIGSNIEEKSYEDNFVAVCSNIKFLNRYIQSCNFANYEISILLCETEKTMPVCNIDINSNKDFQFVGYDYAYIEPDYYSCVFHDIPRIPELSRFTLNQYGLFNSFEKIKEFIKLRDTLKEINSKSKFEIGRFYIYKLWEYIGELPITY